MKKAVYMTGAALVVACVSGCTLQYDRYGNPIGAGLTLAATEEPTTTDNLVQGAKNAAWLVDPKLGILVAGVAGAFGYGNRSGRNVGKEKEASFNAGSKRQYVTATTRVASDAGTP